MVKIYAWLPRPDGDPRGSGKTGGMTWHLYQKKLEGRRILTNYTTSFTDHIINADMMAASSGDPELQELFRDKVIGITEIHQFLESRRTQKTDQLRVSYSLLQLRKLRSPLHWDSQADHQVEKRLLDQTDYLIYCENLGCGEITCKDRECGIRTCGFFHYEMRHRRTGQGMGEWWLHGPDTFYPLFDSEELSMDFFTEKALTKKRVDRQP